MGFCVLLNSTPHIVIAEDISEPCMREVEGCAILQNGTVYARPHTDWRKTMATVYHELLHLELGADHSCALLNRDNAFRDAIGVFDRMVNTQCAG